jgi:hypothetical protein
MFPKFQKYHSKIVVVDGIKFHSQKEANYYSKLKILEKYKEIGNLKLQVKFSFDLNGIHICSYYLDFSYTDKLGKEHYVDVKGFKTKEYIIKKKMMKAFYGIEIEEC